MNNIRKEACEENVIHQDVVKRYGKKVIGVDESIELAEFLKIFGDATRIRIISLLSKTKACVCDISAILDMTHSAISHQLKILRDAKLVKYTKVGKVVYYELLDEHVKNIYEKGREHIKE